MSAAAPDRAGILIVDDMEENLIALEAVLGPLDQRLVRAHSGEEALKAMLRQEFAVVLLDVLMPGMDGFETAANMKRIDQTKDVPIILLTGTDADSDYPYRGYAIGAADFLTKPIDPWLLRTKVNVFLDLHRKNLQLAAQAEQLRRQLAGEPDPSDERLERVSERLARTAEVLREGGGGGEEASGLADCVTELTRTVEELRAARQAYQGQ
ncbi:response regulator/sensor histidine kinase AsgD [Streptomyces himastatinicus ATCC 53653]|uniref:Response regulator/sensor histidine kinase AsgD n=1 Tax=Streptomyces himastatinicus ATCC 53653 TaxID=457427 RepID=D9WC91_9ACTN|nr:response regulator [Streptomyces himastatinicus]EFL27139.1 response regulator/sensor histidine kinase AsgD [Streptomyces himastatinicus ATCC 53653]